MAEELPESATTLLQVASAAAPTGLPELFARSANPATPSPNLPQRLWAATMPQTWVAQHMHKAKKSEDQAINLLISVTWGFVKTWGCTWHDGCAWQLPETRLGRLMAILALPVPRAAEEQLGVCSGVVLTCCVPLRLIVHPASLHFEIPV